MFNKYELSDIDQTMRLCFGEFYSKTLLLHKYSCAAFFLNELYGSSGSHSANSSMVHVRTRHHGAKTTQPGIMRRYLKVSVLLRYIPVTFPSSNALPPNTSDHVTVYLAVINSA